MLRIEEHNANPYNTYQMGVNQFSDLTDAEFKAQYLTFIPPNSIEVISS